MGKQKETPQISTEELKGVQLRQNQKLYSQKIIENEVTFCYGPAGTSKTFTAAYTALKILADRNNDIRKIICTKPIQESGEKLGYLPGTVDEKIQPFVETFRNNFDKIINKKSREFLESCEQIEYRPLAYMRGATFDNAVMILDEAQNCNFKQLMLFVTRLGKDSKVIISGDIEQSDIINNNKTFLDFYKNVIEDVKGASIHIFTEDDIVRSKILKEICKNYSIWKSKNDI